eukprot:PhF_6_TR26214/c0_g1_i2/m.37362
MDEHISRIAAGIPTSSVTQIASQYVDLVDHASLEGHVLMLVYSILMDAENDANKRYKPDAILAGVHPGRMWSVPHRVLLQNLAMRSPVIRRVLLVLNWLETTEPVFHAPLDTKVQGYAATPTSDGVDASEGLNSNDKEHEEALMLVLLKSLRRGDFTSAIEAAKARGMHWRSSVFQSIIPSPVENAQPWFRDVCTVPVFGEFKADNVNGAATDSQRGRVLSTLYRTQHKGATERYKALHNAINGALCGDVSLVLPCMGSWRDKLWAVLRCNMVLILSRYIHEVARTEGVDVGYIALFSQYGAGGAWLQKAEEEITRAAMQCFPDSFQTDMDALTAHMTLGLLTNEAIHFTKALEVSAKRISVEKPTFSLLLMDLLARGFARSYVPVDVQLSSNFEMLLKSFSRHVFRTARTKSDVIQLLCTPLAFLCFVRNPSKRTQYLAEYFRDLRADATSYMTAEVLEKTQEKLFEVVQGLLALYDPALNLDAAIVALRESIAAASAGDKAAPADAVMWLSTAITPAHSERALRQSLVELRNVLGASGTPDAVAAKEILAVTSNKVLPQFDVRISVEHDSKICEGLERYKQEFDFWKSFVVGVECAGAGMSGSTAVIPVNPGRVSAYGTLTKGKEEIRQREFTIQNMLHITNALGSFCSQRDKFEEGLVKVLPKVITTVTGWCEGVILSELHNAKSGDDVEKAMLNFSIWIETLEGQGVDEVVNSSILESVVHLAQRLYTEGYRRSQILNAKRTF